MYIIKIKDLQRLNATAKTEMLSLKFIREGYEENWKSMLNDKFIWFTSLVFLTFINHYHRFKQL